MELEYLTILEERVQEMIEMIKTLRQEKSTLELQLSEREKSHRELQQERGEVRHRVEKILGTLNHLNNGTDNTIMEKETEQATSY